jgi:hypothetical protein
MIGDAENEKLADPDPEHVPRFMIETSFAQHANPVIEEAAIAQHREENAVKEAAVGGGEIIPSGMPIDQGLGIDVSLRPRAQC